MQREYHKWHSEILGRDMELLVFGQGGTPLLVFPTSMGRFYQYEDQGMIAATQQKYESGELQAFCVDSVDEESWYNKGVSPHDRVQRHLLYERYIIEEVLPFIRERNHSSLLVATGCSFGGYHCVNFALRHPDLVTHCISMAGAFSVRSLLDGQLDTDAYLNSPVDFLPNLNDGWYWERYQQMQMILAVGEKDICLASNLQLDAIMNAKSIRHWLDVWGNGAYHDWPIWRQMAVKYF